MRLASYILILFLLSTYCTKVHAQFLLTEDFSGYQSGSIVQNAVDPGNPDKGEWVSVGSAFPTVVDGQLSYPNYVFAGRGKTLEFGISGNEVSENVFCISRTHLPYPCQPEGGFTDGSNEFYTAFLLNLSASSSDDVQEVFSYYQLLTGSRWGCIFYKLSTDKTKVAFSFQKNPDNPSSTWTQYYDKTQTFLLVVKYSHVCINEKNLGHSEFQLFINPDPLKSEDENSTSKISAYGNDTGYDTDLRYVNFRQSGKTTMRIAGIRIANSFEKVLRGPDNTAVIVLKSEKQIFKAEGKALIPQQDMNGTLKIYDISSRCLQMHNVQGKKPIETGLEQGVYVLNYFENGNTFVQKILIR